MGNVLLGNTHAHEQLDLSVGRDLWAALFHEWPSLSNPLAAEVTGGGYTRPKATMVRTSRRLVNNNTLIFPGVPAGVMVAVGLFTAPTNGELWLATGWGASGLPTPGGQSVALQPGEMAFAA